MRSLQTAPSGKEIRRRAWSLYKSTPGLLLVASALCYLPTGLLSLARDLIPFYAIVYPLFYSLLYPLFVGVSVLYLGVFRGEPLRLVDAFRYYRRGSTLRCLFLVGLGTYAVASLVPSVLNGGRVDGPAGVTPLRMLMLLAWMVLVFVWIIRIYPLPYLYAQNSDIGPVALLRTAWRRSRGAAGGIFAFTMACIWPPVVAIVVIVLPMNAAMRTLGPVLGREGRLIAGVLFLLYAPFMQISFAGYAQRFLAPDNGTD